MSLNTRRRHVILNDVQHLPWVWFPAAEGLAGGTILLWWRPRCL